MKILYVPYPDLASAKKAAASLLERKLIACANLIGGSISLYVWEGKNEESEEVIAWFKTSSSLATEAAEAIRKEHPYQCPCVAILPVEQLNPAYLTWIEGQL